MYDILKRVYNVVTINIMYPVLRKKKINKKTIFFESFLGRTLDDNVGNIYEVFSKNYPEYKLVWSVTRGNRYNYPNAIYVRRFGIKYFYYLSTSKCIITNSRMPNSYVKKKGQIYFQTWHGTPLKKLVFDMENVKVPNTSKEQYFYEFSQDVDKWDYLLSQNRYSTNIFKSCFRYTGEILEYGYPRNYILHHKEDLDLGKIKKSLKIPKDKKILLYTPTYRENKVDVSGKYDQSIVLDLEKLAKNEDYVFLIRAHYLIAKSFNFSKYDNIIDVSSYENINELYLISDVLLNDYSSTMFDYAVLKKPMIFYPYDLEEYENEIRGFYFSYEKVPGRIINSTEELNIILENLEEYILEYKDRIKQFNENFIIKDEEIAANKIVKKLRSEHI